MRIGLYKGSKYPEEKQTESEHGKGESEVDKTELGERIDAFGDKDSGVSSNSKEGGYSENVRFTTQEKKGG